ncbi:MAG: hypothetical protein Sapg2KO_27210 [Saprospiraceae bacterium]
MKNDCLLFLLLLLLASCTNKAELSSISPTNWADRTVTQALDDSLTVGKTYLSIYSQIYSLSEHRTHDLTATVSMRNTSTLDTAYILSASYYDTKGQAIRNYFSQPIFLLPMETVEIVIDEEDETGGTGANFLFEWKVKEAADPPFFEGVMISTSGQQGLSFTTQGILVK